MGDDGLLLFFFFKQKTAYEIGTGDWSSDVCSSDLAAPAARGQPGGAAAAMPAPSYRFRGALSR